MKDVLSEIEKYKLLPVVTLHDEEEAVKVLGALGKGGLPMAEICFRTPYAPQALALAEKFPDMMFGAGTVLDAKSCTLALDAGAKFVVSPGLSEEVNAVCRERGVPYFPGIVTPTELMRALALGIGSVKFFPASDFGGVKAIRDACQNCDIIVIDEVGKMEVESQLFIDAVKEALDADKPMIITLHKKSRNPLLQDIRRRDDVRILEVTPTNRNILPYKIVRLMSGESV